MHLLAEERALVAHAVAAVDLEPRRVVGDAVADALRVANLREGVVRYRKG